MLAYNLMSVFRHAVMRQSVHHTLATLHRKVLAVRAFWDNPKIKPNQTRSTNAVRCRGPPATPGVRGTVGQRGRPSDPQTSMKSSTGQSRFIASPTRIRRIRRIRRIHQPVRNSPPRRSWACHALAMPKYSVAAARQTESAAGGDVAELREFLLFAGKKEGLCYTIWS